MSKADKKGKIDEVYSYLLGIETLIDIRKDFFEIYLATLKSERKKRVNRECDYYYSKALEVGAYSESYNPNKDLIKKFAIFQFLWRVIGGIGIIGYLSQPILIFLAPIPIILELSTNILSKDTALTQYTNKKLRYNFSELKRFKRNQYQICSAFIWNNSLMHNKTIPILQMFRFLKLLLPNYFYRKIINGLKMNTSFYLDHNKTLIGSPAHKEYLMLISKFKRISQEFLEKLSSLF